MRIWRPCYQTEASPTSALPPSSVGSRVCCSEKQTQSVLKPLAEGQWVQATGPARLFPLHMSLGTHRSAGPALGHCLAPGSVSLNGAGRRRTTLSINSEGHMLTLWLGGRQNNPTGGAQTFTAPLTGDRQVDTHLHMPYKRTHTHTHTATQVCTFVHNTSSHTPHTLPFLNPPPLKVHIHQHECANNKYTHMHTPTHTSPCTSTWPPTCS